jgi:hypothetical protein
MKKSISFGLFLLLSLLHFSCRQNHPLFQMVPSSHSGIHFINAIKETDSLNPIDVTNIYNGGGVGISDFNNDGLQDIFFAGNRVSNKLYLNKGNLVFADITDEAGVDGGGKWCRGVSVADINADGWMDIYVCASMDKDPVKRRNLLYINQGVNEKGVPTFKEMAASYGLDDSTHSTMANFFDLDNDGDLDLYLVVNQILPDVNPSIFRPKITDGSFPSTGRLYRNDYDPSLGHPVFTDITRKAGLTIEGYGHAATIADINQDGWKDIFVTNDFIANDLLYINNHDGTFTDRASSYFKHTSANGMGQDIIDINNDGLADVIELDMNPEDNYRKKMMLGSSSYQTSQLNNFFSYQYQFVRNTLQLNQGPRIHAHDSIGDPVFSEIGFAAGISETDWSWTPLVADFDNDGLRDLVVTNGFPRDITDHDFIAFRRESSAITPLSTTLFQIPEVKLHKYAFKNTGDCRFQDVSKDWGLIQTSFSNGAAYADLDNDGDLDIVINNINDEASIYENTVMDGHAGRHYLDVQLNGDSSNTKGLGAWITLFCRGKQQVYEQTPFRGYLSTIQLNPHFGLDTAAVIDSVIIKWPDGSSQSFYQVVADEVLHVDKKNAKGHYSWDHPSVADKALFEDVTDPCGIHYIHSQQDHIDFNIQKILPHKFSEYGPGLASGDINGDGLDDIIVGGNSSTEPSVFLQKPDGTFIQKIIPAPAVPVNTFFQDMSVALLDADGDGDLDLYLSRGGYESAPFTAAYNDLFFVNDGKGNFVRDSLAFPANFSSKSCVRIADIDKDGDPDLFIAGRVEPWSYPKPVSSFIYRNDSEKGHIRFSDITNQAAPALKNIGLVCDALFTDYDNDGWPDLLLAGEWMPITILKNRKGVFTNETATTGIADKTGWWNSVAAADFDNDGDIDYIVGNLGNNSYFRASPQYPVSIYAKDFDNNKSYDAVISMYLPGSQENTAKKEFPVPLRDDLIKQVFGMRSKFPDYKSYARAEMNQLFTSEQLEDAVKLKVTELSSSYCRNDGNGRFTLLPLPFQAQLSVLNGMVADDLDGDGNMDVVINGNDFGTDVSIGHYDALNGLLLKGDGHGNFIPQSILESGIYIPGNGKALVKLRDPKGRCMLAASQNRGRLKVFALRPDVKTIPLAPDDVSAEILYKNGNKQDQEFYYGCSFLSQSSRFISLGKEALSVSITDSKGHTRRIGL